MNVYRNFENLYHKINIPDFTIDSVTLTPNTLKANNINEDLKNKAIEISSSAEALTNGFDEYVESVKEEYGVDADISMTEVDKKLYEGKAA